MIRTGVNRTIGVVSSSLLTLAVALFAISMFIGAANLSYGSSLILSCAYVVVVAALSAESTADRKAAAYAGLAFATLYSAFATTVYFVQLTTVLHQTAAPEILNMLSYRELGSLMFNLDLLGYAFMSASTFFIGLTLWPGTGADRALKILLIVHGVFAPACVVLPISNIFGSMADASSANIGVAALIFWCAYFTPVGILLVYHFKKGGSEASAA